MSAQHNSVEKPFAVCIILVLLILLPAVARAQLPYKAPSDPELHNISDRFKLATRFRAAYVYSDINDGDSVSGWDIAALIAPHFNITENAKLILLYDGKYYRKREYYSDDLGTLERIEYQSHTITPMVRISFGKNNRYALTPAFFYTTTLNKDFEDSDWGDGLYNYDDIGGGIDFSALGLGFGGADGRLKLGAQLYKREYPNYTSLLDLSTGLNIEPDEKDYLGISLNAGYTWYQKTGFAWHAEYTLLNKMLEDKKVVNADGVLTGDTQTDYYHSLVIGPWYRFSWGLKIGLDLNATLYQSNQNYYDGLDNPDPTDYKFMSNFFDYTACAMRPNIGYQFSGIPLSMLCGYTIMQLDYSDRLAKFSDGSYKTEEQSDTLREFELRLQYAFLPEWKLYAIYQNTDNDSNNKDERVYRYSYTVNNFYIGIAYQY